MPSTRNLLGSIRIEVGATRRRCVRCRRPSIGEGEQCVVIRQTSSGAQETYCKPHALQLLRVTTRALAELYAALGETLPRELPGQTERWRLFRRTASDD